MGVFKHLKTLFPIPSKWEGEDRNFALRLENAYKEIQIALDKIAYGKESVAVDTLRGCGYITSSGKKVNVTFPVDKIIPDGTYVVTSFNVIIRGINGYANSQSSNTEYVGESGYTVTAIRANNGRSFNVTIEKSTAFTNITNNTPIFVTGRAEISIT